MNISLQLPPSPSPVCWGSHTTDINATRFRRVCSTHSTCQWAGHISWVAVFSNQRIKHKEFHLNGLVPRRDHWAGLAAINRGLRRLAVILQSKAIHWQTHPQTCARSLLILITIVIITSNSITITIAIHWRLAMFLQRHPQIQTKYVRRGFKLELIHSFSSAEPLRKLRQLTLFGHGKVTERPLVA